MRLRKLWGLAAGLGGLLVLAPAAGAEEAAVPAGKQLFLDHKCQACHAIESQGIKVEEIAGEAEEAEDGEAASDTKPSDLSNVGNLRKAEFLDGFLRKKEMLDGKKHQKRFKGTPEERKQLIDWLMTLKEAPKK